MDEIKTPVQQASADIHADAKWLDELHRRSNPPPAEQIEREQQRALDALHPDERRMAEAELLRGGSR